MRVREVREVSKIANYWRICCSLAHLSRSYRILFARPQLETLEPYKPTAMERMKVKRFVHAEVQMVVFYETCFPPPWPRAIGASKEACFLCDAFISAHGYFYLSKAHRQLFHKWTVPDRSDYTTATLKRFRSALKIVNEAVLKELEVARRKRVFRPFPLQSSINLHKLILPAPSVTTIRSSSTETQRAASPIAPTKTSRPATPGPVSKPANNDSAALDGKRSRENFVPASTVASPQEASPLAIREQSIPDDVVAGVVQGHTHPIAITANTISSPTSSSGSTTSSAIFFTSAVHRRLDWLSLHIELESGCLDRGKKAATSSGTARAFSRASVCLKSAQSSEAVSSEQKIECFSVDDLSSGKEIAVNWSEVKEEDYDGARPEARFILLDGSRDPVQVSCRWYRT